MPDTDCIVFDAICCIENSSLKTHAKYGIEFEYYTSSDETEWRGKPAHTMVYKSSIAKAHSFLNISYGEDLEWVSRAWKDIKHQTRIEKILYYYDYQKDTTSETRGISEITIQENIKK